MDVSADRVITSFGGTCRSVSSGIVDEMAVSNYSAAARQQLVVPVHTVDGPTSSIISPPYQQHQYHYINIHHAAPPYYRDDPALIAGRDQRFVDDIDDILSVMASVAGSPSHVV